MWLTSGFGSVGEAGSWRWAAAAEPGPGPVSVECVCAAVTAATVDVCERVSAGWGSAAAGRAAVAGGVGRRPSPWAEGTSLPSGPEECTGGTWASSPLASHLWASCAGSYLTSWTVQSKEGETVWVCELMVWISHLQKKLRVRTRRVAKSKIKGRWKEIL